MASSDVPGFGVSPAQVNGHAQLEITDTGIGIPAEDLPKVFDRFYRADPSRSTQSTPGARLGLSICRSNVEAHGGRIVIESTPREGTRVSVFVPAGTRNRA
ncbi:MAG: sensor histidine kinase [Planctomycetota bacterium]